MASIYGTKHVLVHVNLANSCVCVVETGKLDSVHRVTVLSFDRTDCTRSLMRHDVSSTDSRRRFDTFVRSPRR